MFGTKEGCERLLDQERALLRELEKNPFLGNGRDFLLARAANRPHDVEHVLLPRMIYVAAMQLHWARQELQRASEMLTEAARYGKPIQVV